MKNKSLKKGFTLIELLAVIVILAIISLIAVPIVLNIIDDSKNSSNLRSAENIVKSINLSLSKLDLEDTMGENKLLDGWYCISDGCTLNPLREYISNIEIENNSSKNNSLVLIQNNQVIDYSIVIDDYKITKDGSTKINSETLYSEIYGKKTLFIGDSVSAMNGGYAKLIAENYLNKDQNGNKINDISSCGYERARNYPSSSEPYNNCTVSDLSDTNLKDDKDDTVRGVNFSHSGYGFTNQISVNTADFPIHGELFLNYSDTSGFNLPYNETLAYNKLNYKTEETYVSYDPDYVIIEGAYNDKSFEIGEYSEFTLPERPDRKNFTTDVAYDDAVNDYDIQIGKIIDSFDPTTIIGGLQKTFLIAKHMYPDAKIGYILVYKIKNENFQKDMIQSIIDTCIKMDVPILNLHDGLFHLEIGTTEENGKTFEVIKYKKYTKENGYTDPETVNSTIKLNSIYNIGDLFIDDFDNFVNKENDIKYYLMCDLLVTTPQDRVHLSPIGLNVIYKTIAQWMNTL